MFGKRLAESRDEGADRRLDALLKEWNTIEPGPGFDEAVWRRIGAAAEPAPGVRTLADTVLEWLRPWPVMPTSVAAAVAILLGIWTGSMTRQDPGHRLDREPLLAGPSLAGTYVAMTRGEWR